MMNRKKICRLLITAMMIMTLFGCEQKQAEPVDVPEFTYAAEVSLLAAYQETEEAEEITEETTEPTENNSATSNEDSTTRIGSNRSASGNRCCRRNSWCRCYKHSELWSSLWGSSPH